MSRANGRMVPVDRRRLQKVTDSYGKVTNGYGEVTDVRNVHCMDYILTDFSYIL